MCVEPLNPGNASLLEEVDGWGDANIYAFLCCHVHVHLQAGAAGGLVARTNNRPNTAASAAVMIALGGWLVVSANHGSGVGISCRVLLYRCFFPANRVHIRDQHTRKHRVPGSQASLSEKKIGGCCDGCLKPPFEAPPADIQQSWHVARRNENLGMCSACPPCLYAGRLSLKS